MHPLEGTFIWYELSTPDPAAAESFYTRVFGWTTTAFGNGHDYRVIAAGGINLGGLMRLPENACGDHAAAGWVGYVGVEDVDATAGRILAAGGSILKEPTDIPGVGRFAVAADPHGAVFLLIRGASPEAFPVPAPDAPGHVGWRELHAGNGKEAFAFYSGLFGWTPVEAVDMGDMGIYQTFATGAGPAGGMMTKMPEAPAPFWTYYFNVAALDPAMARVKEHGGQVLMGPCQVPGGQWIAQCQDPQGAWFAMLAPAR